AVPGVAEHAFRLEVGAGARSAAALRLRLRENADRVQRVIIIGGAETGIEAAGEIKTASPNADVVLLRLTVRQRKGRGRGRGCTPGARRTQRETRRRRRGNSGAFE